MPKVAKELSALEVNRLNTPGLWFVGGVAGLGLQVLPKGGRTWILRTSVAGKRRDIGLGGFPTVTLAGARQAARTTREKIKQGIDPVDEAKAIRGALAASRASEMTFSDAAKAFISAKEAEWSNVKHAAQWRNTISTYVEPFIGKVYVRDVETSHIAKVLEPIWLTKNETASRLRGRIESILDWSTVRGYRKGDNPARWRGHLDHILAKPSKVQKVEHHAALPYAEIGAFMVRLRKQEGMGARALEFAILTAMRSGEVRGATWDEINLDQSIWIIPGERMKAKKEHRVPLSDDAVTMLRTLPRFGDSKLLFPNNKGDILSDMTLTAVLRRMSTPVTAHGFRSTFRDWAAERTNYPREVAEMALAHTLESKVEAAYLRTDMFEKRRRMMRDWAKFCATLPPAGATTVTPIGVAA